jgi:Fe2+ transport system protein B
MATSVWPTRRKYHNVPTVQPDGTRFDSRKEARRWAELQLLERAGLVRDLQRQVSYELAPSVKFAGAARAQPPLRLIVDFRYTEGGQTVLEDVKGGEATETDVFRVKRHLLLHLFGLQVRIT